MLRDWQVVPGCAIHAAPPLLLLLPPPQESSNSESERSRIAQQEAFFIANTLSAGQTERTVFDSKAIVSWVLVLGSRHRFYSECLIGKDARLALEYGASA
jgi:hypothetical protein